MTERVHIDTVDLDLQNALSLRLAEWLLAGGKRRNGQQVSNWDLWCVVADLLRSRGWSVTTLLGSQRGPRLPMRTRRS